MLAAQHLCLPTTGVQRAGVGGKITLPPTYPTTPPCHTACAAPSALPPTPPTHVPSPPGTSGAAAADPACGGEAPRHSPDYLPSPSPTAPLTYQTFFTTVLNIANANTL